MKWSKWVYFLEDGFLTPGLFLIDFILLIITSFTVFNFQMQDTSIEIVKISQYLLLFLVILVFLNKKYAYMRKKYIAKKIYGGLVLLFLQCSIIQLIGHLQNITPDVSSAITVIIILMYMLIGAYISNNKNSNGYQLQIPLVNDVLSKIKIKVNKAIKSIYGPLEYINKYILVIICTLCFTLLSLIYEINISISIVSFILLLGVLIVMVRTLLQIFKSTNETINISSVDISLKKLHDGRVLTMPNFTSSSNGPKKMYKIDFSPLIKEGAIQSCKIVNNNTYHFSKYNQYGNDVEKSIFYFVTDFKRAGHVSLITLVVDIDYSLNTKVYKLRKEIKIELVNNLNRQYVRAIYVHEGRKRFRDNKDNTIVVNRKEYFNIVKRAIPNVFQFEYLDNKVSSMDIKILNNHPNIVQQKIAVNANDYGTGKTTQNIIYAQENHKTPVVFSPMETNQKHDFLYSLLQELQEQGKYYFYRTLAYKTLIYFGALMTAIYLFLEFFCTDSNPEGIIATIIFALTTLNRAEVLLLIDANILKLLSYLLFGLIFYILIYQRCVMYWITFKSDFITYNKPWIIKEIVNKVQYNNILLIIEDIDRLNAEESESILRDLASLNNQFILKYPYSGIFAIVSLNEIHPKIEDFTDKSLLDVNGKLILGKVFENYDYKKSIDKYLSEISDFLFHFSGSIQRQKFNYNIEVIPNFRSAKELVSKWIKEAEITIKHK